MFKKFLKKDNNDNDFSAYLNEDNNYQEEITNNEEVEPIKEEPKEETEISSITNANDLDNGDSKNYNVEDEYSENGFKNFVKKTTHNKIFYIVIAILIILLIVVLILRGCTNKEGTLKDIELNVPTTVYMGENTKVDAKALGSGNLKQTSFTFITSNSSIVDLKTKATLKGKSVENTIIPIATGKFALHVKASLGDKETSKEAQITICKRFTTSSISNKDITLKKDETTKLSLDLGTPKECYENISYKVSDSKIISVDKDGNIKGLSIGKASITITSPNSSNKITLNVEVKDNTVKATSITINKSETTIEKGSTEKLIATIIPDNASDKTVVWTSSNDSVVTVSNQGVIKGIGAGTATITATTQDKSLKAEVRVKVVINNGGQVIKDTTPPKVTKLTMVSNNADQTLATAGNKITINVTFSENLGNKPQIELANQVLTVTGSNNTYQATYTVTNSTKLGLVDLKVSSYKDTSGNTGSVVTNVTSGKKVTIYTLSNWSTPTLTKCTTGELCREVKAYQTRNVGTWSAWTTNYCNPKNTDTCKTTTLYRKRTVSTSTYYDGGGCGSNAPTGYKVCSKDGVFYPGECTPSICNGYKNFCQTAYECKKTSYSNWSNYSTSACSNTKDSECQTATGYQTRTVSSWSTLTTNACNTKNTDTCKMVNAYQTRTRITK